jgi:hypothetical protein
MPAPLTHTNLPSELDQSHPPPHCWDWAWKKPRVRSLQRAPPTARLQAVPAATHTSHTSPPHGASRSIHLPIRALSASTAKRTLCSNPPKAGKWGKGEMTNPLQFWAVHPRTSSRSSRVPGYLPWLRCHPAHDPHLIPAGGPGSMYFAISSFASVAARYLGCAHCGLVHLGYRLRLQELAIVPQQARQKL